jgi:hypothetical protein
MRRALCRVFLLALAAIFLGGAGAGLAGSATHIWAGQWKDSFGGFGLRLMNSADLKIAQTEANASKLIKRMSCAAGAEYYRGGYNDTNDTGKLIGCTTSPTTLVGRYVSDKDGHAGSFSFTMTGTGAWTGTYQDDGGTPGHWTGTFLKHFAGDGCCVEATPSSCCQWVFVLKFEGDPLYGHGEGQHLQTGLNASIVDQGCVHYRCQGCPESPCTRPPITVPAIHLKVTDAELSVTPLVITPPNLKREIPSFTRTLTLAVTVSATSNENQCKLGDTGTVVLTDRDTSTAGGVIGSRFEIGGWKTPCAGHTYSLDGLGKGAVGPGDGLAPGLHYVYVQIACHSDGNTASSVSPRYCH